MRSAQLLLFTVLVAIMATHCQAGLLDYFYPRLMAENYSQVPTKEGYRFEQKDDENNTREEIGVIMNPGTPDEQLVRMGTYTTYDEKTDTESITMYTADKDGYKARYMIKNRKLSPGALKSAAG